MNMKTKLSVRNSKSCRTISMVQVGMMAALVYIATAIIAIPVGESAVIHLGDTVLFLCAILLGKKKGAVAAAIGMTFFDLFSPYYIWAPFTLVIKATMAYIAGTIAYRNNYEGDNLWNNLFAFIVAGIFMIGGYFIAGGILNHFVYGIPTLSQGFLVAIKDIPANIIQSTGGIIIALPLSLPLKKYLAKYI
ncbi:MAG: ECF transporter S component [Clostridium sp.]|uniref:ECF transporter S component n=1 Tax=Clostridium sp. TaxID=1506 RepID=UPI00306B7D54